MTRYVGLDVHSKQSVFVIHHVRSAATARVASSCCVCGAIADRPTRRAPPPCNREPAHCDAQ